ncbi:PMU1-high copy suppressor of ts tps2 mutant phenotype [Fusarium albosuccineum]|uniref:PMU1-high copy suppressor of ts tps2 mutant phenotype n=1 Tax=Fusarium albosuccineum TaxID=1237068 RepID=A0A8H4KY73_9HYPO|nr:PMU1-high copy suppressor of ts tps2 mutant phenotype [Fusarium albosuccineum]
MVPPSTCSYRFCSEKDWFIDYAEAARASPRSNLMTQVNLGLLSHASGTEDGSLKEKKDWGRFSRHIQQLNDGGDPGVSYKVLLVVRHGRGVHNVVMDEVGSSEWKTNWFKLDGDGDRTWFDAELVKAGAAQATALGMFYEDGIRHLGFPVPDALYTSPLARCLETTKLVFEDIMKEQGMTFKPVVKELLRERLTDHTCDRKRTKDWITVNYPEYEVEAGFTDEDLLWHADRSESKEEHVARTQSLLEDIWAQDSGTVVALVTHSYTLSSILEVIDAPHFRVGEGVMTAFLVRGERVGVD